MKKRIGLYIAAWAALLALFNVIAFVSVGWAGEEKYTPSFWIGYSLISVAFVGQLLCALYAFKADSANKLFYNLSLVTTSYSGLIASFVFGGLCMLISPLPYWVGVILCAIVLVLNLLAVIKATAAVSEVSAIDEKIKTQTFFIKTLIIDAESLTEQAKSDEVKAECKKICDEIRYSDPMSNNALASVESQITIQFSALTEAVEADDCELVRAVVKNITVLLADRNKKCKLLK
ncbi:MAG: hypothetical protein IJV72_08165 [Clostridia bacterium]|nr:hypothetical protein [Clostridia bacterium]